MRKRGWREFNELVRRDMTTFSYLPSSLPPVSAVEVVVLDSVEPKHVGSYMQSASNAPSVKLEGEQALSIAALWRQLPPGHQARCHTPPFGLRFFVEEDVVCQASICWECDNIFGDVGGTSFCYEFSSKRPISRKLLAELRQIVKVAFDDLEKIKPK